MNVFISWRGSDREIKNRIVEALREALGEEDTVWESDEGCTTNFSKECIAALRSAHVFVLIVSDETVKPSYVINELIEANDRAKKGELDIVLFRTTDAPYSEQLTLNINHLTDNNHVARMQGDDSGIPSLVKKVIRLLDKRKNGNPDKPYEIYTPVLDAMPVSFGGYFVGHSRDTVLDRIAAAFGSSDIVFLNQMSGYGRKSAAREYARLHRSEYSQILILHQFSGSLREFFTEGIVIKNLNENVFDSLSEDEVIRKKADYLSRLSPDTLLIVPNLRVNAEEDRFLLDAVGQIGCRVIFITENISAQISETFPSVDVGRMDDSYLDELFFHYYTKADTAAAESILPTLHDFFSGIGGHTKSVEIVAKTLNADPKMTPECIPATLADLGSGAKNDDSDRIFRVLANVFDMQDLPETEKRVLLFASILCQIPVGLSSFLDFLKDHQYDSSEAVSDLRERGWLTADDNGMTVSVEPLVAKMCYSKMEPDNATVSDAAAYLENRLLSITTASGTSGIRLYGNRVIAFADALGLSALSELAQNASLFSSGEAAESARDKTPEKLRDRALVEIRERYPDAEDSMSNVITLLYGEVMAMDFYGDTANGGIDRDRLYDFVMNDMIRIESLFDVLFEIMPEDEDGDDIVGQYLREFLDALKSGNVRRMYSCILNAGSTLSYLGEENGEMRDFITQIIVQFATTFANALLNPFAQLKLFRPIFRLIPDDGGTVQKNILLDFYNTYFNALADASVRGEEADRVYECTYRHLSENKETLFDLPEQFREVSETLNRGYIEEKIANGEPQRAEAAYRRYLADQKATSDNCGTVLTTVGQISDSYLKTGEPLLCAEFLKNALEGDLSDLCEKKKNTDPSLYEYYTVLKNEAEILTNGETQPDFTDGGEEYRDYYKTYADSFSDKLFLKNYMKIADDVDDFDFSELSDDAFAAETERLRKKAKAGYQWKKLAPEAFALVNEAGNRILGYPYHYVQYLGAAAMADGKIAEMRNGEGKTYAIVLTAYLKALYGKHVRVVDSSRYLTERNYAWMHGIYDMLGMTTCLLSDEHNRSREDDDLIREENCDVIYETAAHLAFTFMDHEIGDHKRTPVYSSLIADEADDLLFTGALQTYQNVIGSGAKDDTPLLDAIWNTVVRSYEESGLFTESNGRYSVGEKFVDGVLATLKNEGRVTVSLLNPSSELVNRIYRDGDTALDVYYEYKIGRDYHIVNGEVVWEQKLDGRFARFSSEADYFIRKKEAMPLPAILKHEMVDSVSQIELIKLFGEICGATATASCLRKAFKKIYGTDVIRIPPNLPPRSVDHAPAVFVEERQKLCRIVELVEEKYVTRQPVLVICGSIYEAEKIGKILAKRHIAHDIISAKNSESGINALIHAGEPGRVTVGTAIVNRGVDILLGGNPYEMTRQMLADAGIPQDEISKAVYGFRSKDGEEKDRDLYAKYTSMLALNKNKTDPAKREVEELGGLCVIGTECFYDLRTEQQVKGRQGRQGAPGESYVLYSLEDPVLNDLIGKRAESLFNLFRMQDIDHINDPRLNHAIFSAREALQNYRFEKVLHSDELNYHAPARRTLTGLTERVYGGEEAFRSVVYEYFASDEEVRNILSDRSPAHNTPPRYRKLRDQIEASSSGKTDPRSVTDAYFQVLKSNGFTEEVYAPFFAQKMKSSYAEYLTTFRKASESVRRMTFSDAKKADMLKKHSDTAVRNAVKAVLELFLPVTVRFRDPGDK